MFKKASLVFFSALWLCSLCLFIYRKTEPTAASDASTQTASSYVIDPTSETVITADSSDKQIKYFYFCTTDNQDCTYMNDTIFKTLASQMNVESFTFLEYVDVEALYGDWTPTKLKSVWGFESYPALVAAKDLGDSFEILNVISWTEAEPLDAQGVKEWMIENELWTGAIEDTGTKIDTPVDE